MKNSYRITRNALLLVLVVGLAAPSLAVAQDWLQVQDPRQPWRNVQGTIEEAVVSIRPKGIYMEYGLYLTFSARGGGFSAFDSLEVQLFFTLPEEVSVTDSWLWVGDLIIRADIQDRWTANETYEGVVRRRQDPSILFKRDARHYELRIFPMAGNEKRKVKITVLVPTEWTAGSVTAPLPTNLLKTSLHPIPSLSLLVWPEGLWRTPRLVDGPGLEFQRKSNSLGTFLQADLPWDAVQQPLTFGLDAPLKNGLFLGRTPGVEEGWYQLALLPSALLDTSPERRVAVLLDLDAARTSVSEAELINTVRSTLLTLLTPQDAFTLIASQLNVRRASTRWLPATADNVDAAIAALGNDPLASYSSLPALLADGIAFIDEHGQGGNLLLVSSSDQFGDLRVANDLIRDLQATTAHLPPIHVADLADRNYAYYYFGGQSYLGNEYLYVTLTRMTGGVYLHVRDGTPFGQVLRSSFSALGGVVNAFDLYTTLDSGFCFSRFTQNADGQVARLDRAVLQVGKCIGTYPFVVEVSGRFESEVFSRQIVLPNSEAADADSTLAALWAGKQILALERGPQTNDVISQIINYSIDQRVLSLYTAFLALDPERGGQVCETCVDDTTGDTAPTPVEDEVPVADQVTLEAYPNPFSTTVTIDVTLPEPLDVAEMTFQVYDAMGRLVKTLRPSAAGLTRAFSLSWDGTNDAGQRVASGTYFFVMTTPKSRHTITLVLVR